MKRVRPTGGPFLLHAKPFGALPIQLLNVSSSE